MEFGSYRRSARGAERALRFHVVSFRVAARGRPRPWHACVGPVIFTATGTGSLLILLVQRAPLLARCDGRSPLGSKLRVGGGTRVRPPPVGHLVAEPVAAAAIAARFAAVKQSA